jgi:hypothetical protein
MFQVDVGPEAHKLAVEPSDRSRDDVKRSFIWKVWFASLPLAEFGLALRANGYSAFHGASRSPLPFDSSISKFPPQPPDV